MKNKRRKQRPQSPNYFDYISDNCWACKNRNNCGGCKFLKEVVHDQKEKRKRQMKFSDEF